MPRLMPGDLGRSLSLRALLVAAVVVTAATVALVAGDRPVGYLAYLVVTGTASVLAWIGAGRWRGRERRAWQLIATAVTCLFAGDVAITVFLLQGDRPEASVADVLWLLAPVIVAVGLFRLGSARSGSDGPDVEVMIDVALATIVGALIAWFLSSEAVIGPVASSDDQLVRFAYLASSVAILAIVVRLVLVRAGSIAGRLLLAAVVIYVVTNLFYLLGASTNDYPIMNVGWMLGPLLIAVASLTDPSAEVADARPRLQVGRLRLALAIAAILVPGALQVVTHGSHGAATEAWLFGATLVIAALVFVRALRFVRANESLRRDLASSQRYYRALATNASDASVVVDVEGRVLHDAPGLHTLARLPRPVVRGDLVTAHLSSELRDQVHALLTRAQDAFGEVVTFEFRVEGAERGQDRWLAARAVDLRDDPDVGGIFVNLHDATERKLVERQLEHQALHDELTGLANRAVLRDRLERAIRRSRRTAGDSVVLYLDLDRFKRINDSLGHDAGDELLRAVAGVLNDHVRTGDTVARLGGDEFAVLLEDCGNPQTEAAVLADRIVEALAAPIRIGDRDVLITASVGVAITSPDATVTSVLRDADLAMYRAKATGRGRWVIYEGEMETQASERLQLEMDLVGALDRGELVLDYQPVVDLETSQVVGFEALLRWHHPTLGRIAPDRFIPLAEESGLIVPIGRWVLRTACEQLSSWRASYPGALDLRVSVNVSARQLATDGFPDHVTEALDGAGLDAGSLVLEMTETVLVEDVIGAATKLSRLHELGVRLAVDDFGTGYSSLGYLRQFPIDVLKVDRSFINTIDGVGEPPAIVRGLLELAATLQLEIVAEGVETEAQREVLRASTCRYAQGFLFSRPLGVPAADRLLAEMSLTGITRSAAAPQG